MAFTIAPLSNLRVHTDRPRVAFGTEFSLVPLPTWVPQDQFLSHLSYQDRESVKAARFALISEYEANSIGEPESKSLGQVSRSIQESKSEGASLCNLALWLACPSPASFTVILHGLHWDVPGETQKTPIIQQSERREPLYCHPDDLGNYLSSAQSEKAGQLFASMRTIPRTCAVWTAMRSEWGALTTYAQDVRFALHWTALESLLGPDGNSGELTFRLSQRIAILISKTQEQARDVFRKAKDCYGTRSQIVHGRYNDSPKMLPLMAATEWIVRSVFCRVLEEQTLLESFLSKQRDRFLEELVFDLLPNSVSEAV